MIDMREFIPDKPWMARIPAFTDHLNDGKIHQEIKNFCGHFPNVNSTDSVFFVGQTLTILFGREIFLGLMGKGSCRTTAICQSGWVRRLGKDFRFFVPPNQTFCDGSG